MCVGGCPDRVECLGGRSGAQICDKDVGCTVGGGREEAVSGLETMGLDVPVRFGNRLESSLGVEPAALGGVDVKNMDHGG